MKMPWKKDSTEGDQSASTSNAAAAHYADDRTVDATQVTNENDASDHADSDYASKAFTPKKGRPTPKRNEVERQHGVRRTAYDAPTTPGQARKRRKDLKASMSKAEYKAMKQRERDEKARERRKVNERMMAGEEAYLMDRDKGREKRFVRDWVDAHRYLMNLFLPMTLAVIVVMIFGMSNPNLANLASLVVMAIFLIMVVEGIVLGRRINREVNERFPDNSYGKFGLGFYAFTRATMIRRLRTPAPQKNVGDKV
ncbi:DUF3043 domain-containing protein [Corynebacterium falsenii]|uniref:DUF3043 domain-containing protein n=1 Tax=Corynebacterium falsenii TaxID=108486 RepID=UPI003FCF54AA